MTIEEVVKKLPRSSLTGTVVTTAIHRRSKEFGFIVGFLESDGYTVSITKLPDVRIRKHNR